MQETWVCRADEKLGAFAMDRQGLAHCYYPKLFLRGLQPLHQGEQVRIAVPSSLLQAEQPGERTERALTTQRDLVDCVLDTVAVQALVGTNSIVLLLRGGLLGPSAWANRQPRPMIAIHTVTGSQLKLEAHLTVQVQMCTQVRGGTK